MASLRSSGAPRQAEGRFTKSHTPPSLYPGRQHDILPCILKPLLPALVSRAPFAWNPQSRNRRRQQGQMPAVITSTTFSSPEECGDWINIPSVNLLTKDGECEHRAVRGIPSRCIREHEPPSHEVSSIFSWTVDEPISHHSQSNPIPAKGQANELNSLAPADSLSDQCIHLLRRAMPHHTAAVNLTIKPNLDHSPRCRAWNACTFANLRWQCPKFLSEPIAYISAELVRSYSMLIRLRDHDIYSHSDVTGRSRSTEALYGKSQVDWTRFGENIYAAWEALDQKAIDSLIRSMPRRIRAVREAKDWYTKY
ncbi:hypothetical protein V8E54_004672 [Elaphomyces granulatus]